MTRRSKPFIEVAYFLSRFGISTPPANLLTDSWKEAYYMFYEALNEGRNIETFEHSLKNARDSFDTHFHENNREGWKDKNGKPIKLSGLNLEVFNALKGEDENAIWERVKKYSRLDIKAFKQEIANVTAIEESEKDFANARTEGGVKVYISHKIERNASLRNDALKIHGYDCAVCGFNFEKTYGIWGAKWAEVHHLTPMGNNKKVKRLTDPKVDLVVLCANCHRMIHRKKGLALTVMELKAKIYSNKRFS
ncbi:hypothetical protein EZ428_13805 [Pedobacter frigiditerrae]|uniref:HNH nuclease domain-containing protein n=1 Tax=Pedobacter frigiditerrae TaxID=2530452 RepID=A0A4R0MUD4_9SPHI|nr:HNH endonuclease [Pedobacter frigiditerrae]TCC90347.1 hypothetical protein EZ428_13805 [Pedobacter frigiditerrae]